MHKQKNKENNRSQKTDTHNIDDKKHQEQTRTNKQTPKPHTIQQTNRTHNKPTNKHMTQET